MMRRSGLEVLRLFILDEGNELPWGLHAFIIHFDYGGLR